MQRLPIFPAGLLLLCAAAPPGAFAHYHILIPEKAAARPGETVRLTLRYGHPHEHELEPCAAPTSSYAFPPSGAPVRLEPAPAPRAAGDAPLPMSRELSHRIDSRGDHVIAVEAAPIIDDAAATLVQDHIKVVIHARSQNGWDRKVGQPLEIVPLVRPYGLRPGWTFQGTVHHGAVVAGGALVEIERYNPVQPPEKPAVEDEFVTRAVRTSADGVFSATLDEPGWWGITAVLPGTTVKGADGKERKLILRSTLWLYVGEPLESRPGKPGER